MNSSDAKIAIGYLTFIPDVLMSLRFDEFETSLASLSIIKSDLTRLLSIDNVSTEIVKKKLHEAKIFDNFVHYDQNKYDSGALCSLMWYAKDHRIPYMMYVYDDFIMQKNSIKDCVEFMDTNSDVHCVRVPAFEKNAKFDAEQTQKTKNPDAVRFYNSINGEKLSWSAPIFVGKSTFFKCNWHYTSRPTLWRTDIFSDLIGMMGEIPVLQLFEKVAGNLLQKLPLIVGVLDSGMMRTTPVTHSARYKLKVNENITLKLDDLQKEYHERLK